MPRTMEECHSLRNGTGHDSYPRKRCPLCREAFNFDAPCVRCGKPTVRGVNSDFCSEECESLALADEAVMVERHADEVSP